MAEPEQVPESHESQEVTEEQQPSTEPTLQSSESPSQGRVKIITESENDSEKEEKQEIPTVPGLTSMIDQWQIAGVPEQNHFFSLQVSHTCVGIMSSQLLRAVIWLCLLTVYYRELQPSLSI